MKVALLNHGCAKNLVDSELMLGLLAEKGHEVTLDDKEAQIVIVNTCSFIHDAEQESVQSILQMVNEGKKVIVTGCLPQKHKKELKKAIPEISAMLGTSDFEAIVDIVEEISKQKTKEYIEKISEKPEYIYPEEVERQQITMGASSYIKIADGCNYHCGYCIIPQLRGAYHSRTIENIVEEAKSLVAKGVTEIVLIAQDTTSYGIDIYGKTSLARLLEELNKLGGAYGVGIADIVEDRLVGMKSRGVYETPGGTILYTAIQELEYLCLDRDTQAFKRQSAIKFAELVYDGKWFTPLRESMSAMFDVMDETVTGEVRLKLYKGSVTPAGAKSPYSLYNEDIASFGDSHELYSHKDSEGFINLFGLPLKVRAMMKKKNGLDK